MKKLTILMVLVTITLLMACNDTNVMADFQTIEIDEVLTKQEEGFTIVDVRETNDYEKGHIEGAINKPISEIQESKFSPLVKGEPYIIICETGNRSHEASEILSNEGYDVINVSEGMSSWDGEVVESSN
ncbi:rhodanese-like domain-containing protein [Alkalibacillus silvisoli]|uniref:Rhodanese domain-containing protein n=1 Tax=Alkalibacillus silvisoli TaxID=392823 RepID=A0ABN1A1S7_9BACI